MLVGDLEAVGRARARAHGHPAAGQGQEPGPGDRARAGVQDQLLRAAEQVSGGLARVLLQQQVAVGVVEVAGGSGAGGVGGQFPVVGPGQGLLPGRQIPGERVPVGVVGVAGGADPEGPVVLEARSGCWAGWCRCRCRCSWWRCRCRR